LMAYETAMRETPARRAMSAIVGCRPTVPPVPGRRNAWSVCRDFSPAHPVAGLVRTA
jgi:hypothetical protein